jgi:glucokinase
VTDSLALGIDVGGTKTRVAIIDEQGRVLLVDEVATSAEGGADPRLERSLALAEDVASRAIEEGWGIGAIGVGMPEYVDAPGRLRSRDVIAWDRQPLEVFEVMGPVAVESDVRCGAVAEATVGAGRDATSMLYVSIGTGISSTLVLDGLPWRGSRGEAIALGELPVDRSLDAGSAATVEQFASGVIESAAVAVGAALAWAVHLVDPERVVLGGGLGASGGRWTDIVRDSYVARSRPEAPPLVPASLGGDSGAVGAGLIALARKVQAHDRA